MTAALFKTDSVAVVDMILQNDIDLETLALHDLFKPCVYIERAACNAARAAADEYLLRLAGKALFAHFTERSEFLS